MDILDEDCNFFFAIADTRRFSYGTAGFREKAVDMSFIAFRVGALAAIRAKNLNKTIGVMITASHNPKEDNGVKIVDPMGEMLAAEWETLATELVNTPDAKFLSALEALDKKMTSSEGVENAALSCAKDTRESGDHLIKAVKAGAALFGIPVHAHGELTTPQLHYAVRVANDPAFGNPGENGYYFRVGKAFMSLYGRWETGRAYRGKLHLDCANGVGASKMRCLHEYIQVANPLLYGDESTDDGALKITYHNTGDGELNHECGADYVKILRKLPAGFSDVNFGQKCAVFDGDADRLLYFYPKEDGEIELLDGDKIAILIAKYFKETLLSLNLLSKWSMGVVQTAYANGNSTKYIRETLGITTVFAPTGVKHLHHEAVKFDIGVYFEVSRICREYTVVLRLPLKKFSIFQANGHGTVVFSDKFKKEILEEFMSGSIHLTIMSTMINEIVGDALADLLAVEVILRLYDWTIQEWANMYVDAPSKQIKVPVSDRSLYTTTHDETRLITPSALQATIDALVAVAGDGARAFVRPSGTENIVRVYAEAASQNDADELAEKIAAAVKA